VGPRARSRAPGGQEDLHRRFATLRSAPPHFAPHRATSLGNTPLRSSVLGNATQRIFSFSTPRSASRRNSTLRVTPHRSTALRIAPQRNATHNHGGSNMRHVKVHLENIPGSPYSQSAKHETPFLDRETHNDYEVRTWREKMTINKDGVVCVPGMGFKQCVDTAAQKLGEKIPGRRGATYKNFFASGFFCDADVPLSNGKPILKKDVDSVSINAHANGKRGSGSRVPRRFPSMPKWHGVAEFTIIDDVITREVFERHVKAAGVIVGIGRFRPENGGTNGRFRAVKFEWEDVNL
jgi:hypothetical protein